MTIFDKIVKLFRRLFPTGRAFKNIFGGHLSKLNEGLALSETRAYEDAVSILDSAIPDNANFSEDDATDWERRLGLITNESVPLADRKLAIARKMSHPGTIPARENYRFLEKQLQDAGFDVYVYENRFDDGMGGYETYNPLVVSGGLGARTPQYGDFQYGDRQYGQYYENIIVNHVNEQRDWLFNFGSNLRSTFFIGGSYLGDFADVDADRKDEFRQLILRTKPVQTVGFLLINYI